MVEASETLPFLVWRWKARQGWRSGFRASSAVATFCILFLESNAGPSIRLPCSRGSAGVSWRTLHALLYLHVTSIWEHTAVLALCHGVILFCPQECRVRLPQRSPYFSLGSSRLLKQGFR